jgi:hypothetical protein
LLEEAPSDGREQQNMARRAVRLYEATSLTLALREHDYAGPVDYAVSALRDLADGYALLANEWTHEERALLPLPIPELVGWLIKSQDVDEWASRSGQRLPSLPASYEAWAAAHAALDVAAPGDLASAFGTVIAAYETVSQLGPSDRLVMSTPEYRNAASREIWSARVWSTWTHVSSQEVTRPITAAMLLIAQGFFVQCWSDASDQLFPSRSLLRALFDESAFNWLSDAGSAAPVWLSPMPQ